VRSPFFVLLCAFVVLDGAACKKREEVREVEKERPKKKPLVWERFRELGGGNEPLGVHPLTKDEASKGWHWRLGSRDSVVLEAERVMPSGKVYRRHSFERSKHGLVTTISDGYGEMRAVIVLEDGKLTRTDRSGVIGDEGCHHRRVALDDKGRFTRLECLDEKDLSVADARGCDVTTRAYDGDQLSLVECVDGVFSEGDHARRSTYDAEGRLAHTVSLDRDSKPMMDLEGCASRKFEYDATSSHVATTCLDLAGALVRETRFTIDANGCELREEKRDKSGGLDPRDGVALRIFKRNALCDVTYEEKRDDKEKRTGEVPARELTLDEHGWLKEERCSDALGGPTSCQYGRSADGAKARYVRDDRGRATNRFAFTHDGKESIASTAYPHEFRYTYGSDGRLSAVAYFDAKGKPSTGVGIHRIAFKYDSVGSETSRMFFDADDGPVSTVTGCHEFRNTFGPHHLWASRDCRDTGGALHAFNSCLDGVCWNKAARVVIERAPGEIFNVFQDDAGTTLRRISCSKEKCYR